MNFTSQATFSSFALSSGWCLPLGMHHAMPGPGCIGCSLALFQRWEERLTAERASPAESERFNPQIFKPCQGRLPGGGAGWGEAPVWGFGAGEIRASLMLVALTVRSNTGTLSLRDGWCFRLPGCFLSMLGGAGAWCCTKGGNVSSQPFWREVFDCFLAASCSQPILPSRILP